ncbi:MAG: hypothetical protein DRI90_23630 [Deltaproteobacteria bacterium]|nr:MAG: hypothetical protein DRI90_23630 [Deltaproteobacteria bacterium]
MAYLDNQRPWRPSLLTIAIVTCLTGTVSAIGCATGTAGGFGGGDTSTSTSGTGNAGGGGGDVGGSGGTTTSSPCAVDCTQIQAPDCQVAQCNAQTGQCEVVADVDGASCDDGLFCTVNDGCAAGTCVGGPQNDCGISAPACTEVSCDEPSQSCSTTPSSNGAACQDPNDLCMKGATCSNGLCTGGTPEDCFFSPVSDDCHVAVCDPSDGQCKEEVGNEGGACNDLNDLCTVSKTCVAGVCQGGQPMSCSHLTQGCVMGVCDVNTGQCTTQSAGEGQPCDDINPCTSGEICTSGVCGGGSPVVQCVANDYCCPSNCNENNDADCAVPSGTARLCNGSFVNVQYYPCGSGQVGQCTAAAAKTACQAYGMKVVSHASDGNSQVFSLGATTSCNWSTSYFTVTTMMPSGACLVGISNLDWSSCCNLTQWHGNTLAFGQPNQTFGYVLSGNSGYVANNPNVTGDTWGCQSLTTVAQNLSGCTSHYVACAP